jgi:transmembrane sensor
VSSSATPDDEVERWAIRLDGSALGEAEQAALDAWLAVDPRRAGLLLRAEAALAYLDRGRAFAEPVFEEAPRQLFGRRLLVGGGALAALASLASLGVVVTRPRPIEIATRFGEMRRVPLTDGSLASINTNSRVEVAMLRGHRRVAIEAGEVWFEVAHDKTRPFVVEAGDVRVEAVGTAFSVRRREHGADVLVTEGAVEAWIVGHEADRRRISAGVKGFVADASPAIEIVRAPADIERALAWRRGELALNGESLEYAASELNRYNTRKLVIDGRALGREPLVGYFRTDQPENFGRAVATLLGARVAIEGETIRLSR